MEKDPNQTNPPASGAGTEKAATGDLTSFLITTLGLTPAEGAESVTEDQIREALQAAIQAGQDATASMDNAAALQSQLTELQAKYDAAAGELATLKAAEAARALDAELAPYADRITDEAARAALRDLMKNNPEAAKALLAGLPAAAPASNAATTEATPPPPMHNPGSEQGAGPDDTQKAVAISTRAKALQAEQPSLSFADAWTKAEREINARLAAGQTLS